MFDDASGNDMFAGAPATVELLHRCNNFTGSTITEEQIHDIDIAAIIQLLQGDIPFSVCMQTLMTILYVVCFVNLHVFLCALNRRQG